MRLVEELELGGILQVASFHPRFQFEGTEVDDVTNCTNRAPYPTLHLLREDSIDKAVEAFPEAETDLRAQHANPGRHGHRRLAGSGPGCTLPHHRPRRLKHPQ